MQTVEILILPAAKAVLHHRATPLASGRTRVRRADQGIYLVSASTPAAMSATEPAATAGSTTASAIDSAFAALASDTTATPTKRKNPFASFR